MKRENNSLTNNVSKNSYISHKMLKLTLTSSTKEDKTVVHKASLLEPDSESNAIFRNFGIYSPLKTHSHIPQDMDIEQFISFLQTY